jgi:hypothetical protein
MQTEYEKESMLEEVEKQKVEEELIKLKSEYADYKKRSMNVLKER